MLPAAPDVETALHRLGQAEADVRELATDQRAGIGVAMGVAAPL